MASTARPGVMARSSLIAATSWSLTLLLLMLLLFGPGRRNVLADEPRNDDSDYVFDEDYEDLPEKRSPTNDDLYIAGDLPREKLVASSSSKEERILLSDDPNARKWVGAERTYRYTKHRIPGYDYDELDYNDGRCDERSVWTHCVCQFTCSEPNIVDCYSPCDTGCECREDFVFDPRTGACVPPNQCTPDDDYLIY